jgi:5-methylcytosine-specific restriction protein A
MGKENENGSRGLAFVGFSYARKERLWPIGRSVTWSRSGTSSSTSSVACSEEGSERMPRSPKKPCAYPGCARLTDKRYCPEHEKLERDRYNKYERSPDINKKYGRAWKRIRDRYVKEHPLCEMCLKEGRLTPVEEVHHIKPISQGGTHARSNLMSLCQSCHTKIHHEIGDR